MNWLGVVMVALAGFFGAGTYSMIKTGHRYTAGVLAAIALVCLAVGVLSMLPDPGQG